MFRSRIIFTIHYTLLANQWICAIKFNFNLSSFDKDIGLTCFGHRKYDSAIGRFITPDPIGFAGGNVDVYGYCLDDPINFYDRTWLVQIYERRLKGLEFLDRAEAKT